MKLVVPDLWLNESGKVGTLILVVAPLNTKLAFGSITQEGDSVIEVPEVNCIKPIEVVLNLPVCVEDAVDWATLNVPWYILDYDNK